MIASKALNDVIQPKEERIDEDVIQKSFPTSSDYFLSVSHDLGF